jgi:two-component system, chemotaxis family, CheB/CheR fusion protein
MRSTNNNNGNNNSSNNRNLKKSQPREQYIVGIGASAGGLEAINLLLENTPRDNGFAIVIVTHLASGYKSLYASLVARHTDRKVLEAEDKMPVITDNV